MAVVCYICSEPGHRKADCPLKRNSRHQSKKRPEKTIQLEEEEEEEGRKQEKTKLPFLLTIHHVIRKQSISRPLERRSQTICFPDLVGKTILASSHGWLVLVGFSDVDCCLWNPGSKAMMIKLPTLHKSYKYNKCILSKPPTEPNCHILFNSYHLYKQSFCKIGDVEFVHQSLKQENSQLVAIASFQGKIYGVMTPGYKFVTIEFVGTTTMELRPMLIDGGERPWKAPVIKRNWVVRHETALIDSHGDQLLLVIKDFTHHNDIIDGSEYRVFRVDINRMACVEIDDIGDQVILIGYYGNGYCCSSTGINTFKPNSIYLTPEYGANVYVYDLDDKSITSFLPPDVAMIHRSDNYWLDLDELSHESIGSLVL